MRPKHFHLFFFRRRECARSSEDGSAMGAIAAVRRRQPTGSVPLSAVGRSGWSVAFTVQRLVADPDSATPARSFDVVGHLLLLLVGGRSCHWSRPARLPRMRIVAQIRSRRRIGFDVASVSRNSALSAMGRKSSLPPSRPRRRRAFRKIPGARELFSSTQGTSLTTRSPKWST